MKFEFKVKFWIYQSFRKISWESTVDFFFKSKKQNSFLFKNVQKIYNFILFNILWKIINLLQTQRPSIKFNISFLSKPPFTTKNLGKVRINNQIFKQKKMNSCINSFLPVLFSVPLD